MAMQARQNISKKAFIHQHLWLRHLHYNIQVSYPVLMISYITRRTPSYANYLTQVRYNLTLRYYAKVLPTLRYSIRLVYVTTWWPTLTPEASLKNSEDIDVVALDSTLKGTWRAQVRSGDMIVRPCGWARHRILSYWCRLFDQWPMWRFSLSVSFSGLLLLSGPKLSTHPCRLLVR